mmetsp:Transcript_15888/g.62083  ORF Transcript_15888/g.62083 Transcript_15888/m.62083 type:complete len:346 (-) Transcript_15888:248-1285(-)
MASSDLHLHIRGLRILLRWEAVVQRPRPGCACRPHIRIGRGWRGHGGLGHCHGLHGRQGGGHSAAGLGARADALPLGRARHRPRQRRIRLLQQPPCLHSLLGGQRPSPRALVAAVRALAHRLVPCEGAGTMVGRRVDLRHGELWHLTGCFPAAVRVASRLRLGLAHRHGVGLPLPDPGVPRGGRMAQGVSECSGPRLGTTSAWRAEEAGWQRATAHGAAPEDCMGQLGGAAAVFCIAAHIHRQDRREQLAGRVPNGGEGLLCLGCRKRTLLVRNWRSNRHDGRGVADGPSVRRTACARHGLLLGGSRGSAGGALLAVEPAALLDRSVLLRFLRLRPPGFPRHDGC